MNKERIQTITKCIWLKIAFLCMYVNIYTFSASIITNTYQKLSQVLVVGNNSIVNDNEFCRKGQKQHYGKRQRTTNINKTANYGYTFHTQAQTSLITLLLTNEFCSEAFPETINPKAVVFCFSVVKYLWGWQTKYCKLTRPTISKSGFSCSRIN